jgi:hypothetical protein
MRKILYLTFINFIYTGLVCGQQTLPIHPNSNSSSIAHQSGRKTDSLEFWNYKFKEKRIKVNDTVELLGTIVFWRTRAVADSSYFRTYGKSWAPVIKFDIFNISDSSYCKKYALKAMIRSNCAPPYSGGDYIVTGKFIFANFDLCVDCALPPSGIDYCRPVINLIFSKVNKDKPTSLKRIFNQFIIKEGVGWPPGIHE